MAKTRENSLTRYFSGKFGNEFGLRNYNGLSVLAKLPGPRRYESTEKQVEVMSRFRQAIRYGKACIADPAAGAFYLSKPKKNKSVYRLAVKDFLNRPEVGEIMADKYKGAPGDRIAVAATDDFAVVKVLLRITDAKGKLLEEGACKPEAGRNTVWSYTATVKIPKTAGVTLMATAYDRPGNKGEGSVTL
jgi:hypothetical protein